MAAGQLREEGLRQLFRGLQPPLFYKTISCSVMFGTYDQYSKTFRHHLPQLSDETILVAAASLAGITEGVMCPSERIQTMLQDKTFHGKYKDIFHVCKSLGPHGVREFYRGY